MADLPDIAERVFIAGATVVSDDERQELEYLRSLPGMLRHEIECNLLEPHLDWKWAFEGIARMIESARDNRHVAGLEQPAD